VPLEPVQLNSATLIGTLARPIGIADRIGGSGSVRQSLTIEFLLMVDRRRDRRIFWLGRAGIREIVRYDACRAGEGSVCLLTHHLLVVYGILHFQRAVP
jgi:hypothetical protein